MIELNNEGLMGSKIVKQLGTPKRAKTLFALNKRIEICEKLIRENKTQLTPKDYEIINEYKQAVALQENALITEVKMMGLKNIKLPPKVFVKEKNELLDKHQARHKDILNGITLKVLGPQNNRFTLNAVVDTIPDATEASYNDFQTLFFG